MSTHLTQVEVVPYNAAWPQLFADEAEKIRVVLADNCVAIHHIGSTSVAGLAAKPIIDMVPVVNDITSVAERIPAMEALGYVSKGENGMLFRSYFQKPGFNVHIFEKGSAEITGHLLFRDWMRTHAEDRQAYQRLKEKLAALHPNDILQYVFGKDSFVKNIHAHTKFSGLRVVKALTPREWDAARHFRNVFFCENFASEDTQTTPVEQIGYLHFILYQGVEIIGYTHIQLCEDAKAILHILAINPIECDQKNASEFLALCERWVTMNGYESINAISPQSQLGFYTNNGYCEMLVTDIDVPPRSATSSVLSKLL